VGCILSPLRGLESIPSFSVESASVESAKEFSRSVSLLRDSLASLGDSAKGRSLGDEN
jgi:hypothetical protein